MCFGPWRSIPGKKNEFLGIFSPIFLKHKNKKLKQNSETYTENQKCAGDMRQTLKLFFFCLVYFL